MKVERRKPVRLPQAVYDLLAKHRESLAESENQMRQSLKETSMKRSGSNIILDWVAYDLDSHDIVATSNKLDDLLDLYSNDCGICSWDNYKAMLRDSTY